MLENDFLEPIYIYIFSSAFRCVGMNKIFHLKRKTMKKKKNLLCFAILITLFFSCSPSLIPFSQRKYRDFHKLEDYADAEIKSTSEEIAALTDKISTLAEILNNNIDTKFQEIDKFEGLKSDIVLNLQEVATLIVQRLSDDKNHNIIKD